MHWETSSTCHIGFYSVRIRIGKIVIRKGFPLKFFHKKGFPWQFDKTRRKFPFRTLTFFYEYNDFSASRIEIFPCNAKQEINLTLPYFCIKILLAHVRKLRSRSPVPLLFFTLQAGVLFCLITSCLRKKFITK